MNEFDYLKRLRERVRQQQPGGTLVCGIGDDAAVFKSSPGVNVVVSSDMLVEDVDFRLATTTAQSLGHKALAVSLSDIAAMGARPKWLLISIGVTEELWKSDFVDQFYDGVLPLARRYGVTLLGGDLSRTPDKVVIDSVVLGECASGREVFRRGAQPGDQIYVTGFLGDAAAGLRLLERGARLHAAVAGARDHNSVDHLLSRHLRPEPRLGWGILLGEKQLATSMIDVSDGLSSDLNHICEESHVGASVDASRLPIDHIVREICGRRALDPLMLALNGGEDFELLFTVKPEKVPQLPARVDGVTITNIGAITPVSEGVQISEGVRRWTLEPGGWEHFTR